MNNMRGLGIPRNLGNNVKEQTKFAPLMVKIPTVAPTISSSTEEEIQRIEEGSYSINDLLKETISKNGSDLHLSYNTYPKYRVDGDLISIPYRDKITDDWLRTQIQKIMPENLWEDFLENGEADFAYSLNTSSRFRVNVFKQRGTVAAVLRSIPTKIKSIEELGVPEVLNDLTKLPKGLVLVTGVTGSGKSTTLAAMIDSINETRQEHIVTIEDPIEFIHPNKKSLVNQREVGTDTVSFAEALKRVLRQDPDIILIGELRDAETISTALTAAETGHLVFGTLHTQSATKTIDRIIDTFPAAQQNQVRSQLADTIQAVISQTLVKKIGGGRVAATEILVSTSAVSSQIREGKTKQIYNDMVAGKNHGMHTLDQDLQRLVREGLVDKNEIMNLMIDKTGLDDIMVKTSDWSY